MLNMKRKRAADEHRFNAILSDNHFLPKSHNPHATPYNQHGAGVFYSMRGGAGFSIYKGD
jgi:hypothetical protein